MKLLAPGFHGIRSGKQTIEVRLFDEKRRTVSVGDTIEFSLLPDGEERLVVTVVSLNRFESFAELFENIPKESWNAAGWSVERCVAACRRIYSEEDEAAFGAIAIGVRRTGWEGDS